MIEKPIASLFTMINTKLGIHEETSRLLVDGASTAYYVPSLDFDTSVRKVIVNVDKARRLTGKNLWMIPVFTRGNIEPFTSQGRIFTSLANISGYTAKRYQVRFLQCSVQMGFVTNTATGAGYIEACLHTLDPRQTVEFSLTEFAGVSFKAVAQEFNIDSFTKDDVQQYGTITTVQASFILVFPMVVLVNASVPLVDPTKVNIDYTLGTVPDYKQDTFKPTDVSIANNRIYTTADFVTGDRVEVVKGLSTDVLPQPLLENTPYYIIVESLTYIRLATTLAKAEAADYIDLTTIGTLGQGSAFIIRTASAS